MLKITITSYEGQPEFSSYTAEVNDDVNKTQFLDALGSVVRAFFPGMLLRQNALKTEERRQSPGHADPLQFRHAFGRP